jgi:hypothetical protein
VQSLAKDTGTNDSLGWKPHWMAQRDDQGGWKMLPAECRFVHYTDELSERIQALCDRLRTKWPRRSGYR